MSRLIVKCLPKNVTKETLQKVFSEYGTVTDIQLKFTEKGEFRKFAFIGYKAEDAAKVAVEALNNSFINTSKIQVEICSTLDDPNKPAAWSKYSAKKEIKINPEKTKNDKAKIKDEEIKEKIEENKDDILFKEFLESHNIDQSEILSKNEQAAEEKNDKDADKNISDLDYLKKKVKSGLEEGKKEKQKTMTRDKNRFTIKISNLPFKVLKKDIKDFFRPLKLNAIRRPVKVKGIAYCDLASEKDLKKALIKNKSFISNKRVIVKPYYHENREEKVEKWKKEEERLKGEESVAESGRIFIRNLAYTVTEEELKPLFEKYGPITELILPIDVLSRKPKGFGFVTYLIPEHACRAFNDLDGTIVQGRMLHLIPGIPKKEPTDEDDADLTFKQKKEKKQKVQATNQETWNSFFINTNSLTEVMADLYHTDKESVLKDDKATGAAVRLALGETQMIQKTKEYLEQHGVYLKAFQNITERSETTILVKNLPYKTERAEIAEKFSQFGELSKVLLSPFGGTAIVEFIESSEAKKAFKRLAFSKFKYLPLYLEWAPKGIFQREVLEKENVKTEEKNEVTPTGEEGCTLFVKNLNFATEADSLRKHFEKCGAIVSAVVAQKKDTKNPGKKLSMGYGFVEFADKESADNALKNLQFSQLEGHSIELKRSNRTTDVKSGVKRKDTKEGKPGTKILIRNIPFQATEPEIRNLFKVFGDLKAVRMPKKMVGTGSHRGFCFVEFLTKHDAKRAFEALSASTHLYGRRLVLEWAVNEDDVETLRQKTARQFSEKPKRPKVSVKSEDEDE